MYHCAVPNYVARKLIPGSEALLDAFLGPDPELSGTATTRIEDCRSMLDKELPLKIVMLSAHPEDDAQRARRSLQEQGVDLHVIAAEMHVEFLQVGANKGTALSHLCERLGLSMDQIAAFGDNNNDVEMLQQVGEGVAMGNAKERVKEQADRVSAWTNDEDGVARELEAMILRGSASL